MLARGILESGWTGSVSSRPFPNSSGWRWLISSVFLIRISCHKTTHGNGYYGAWPGWAVSISVLPLTILPHVWKFFSNPRMDHDMLFCFCFVSKLIFIVFKIKIPHRSDIIWYLSLSDWFNMIISRSIHVAENDVISFLPYKLLLTKFLPSISLVNLRVNSSWISSW